MQALEQSLTLPQISKLYLKTHEWFEDCDIGVLECVDVFSRSSNYDHHQAAYELHHTLGLLDEGIENMHDYEQQYGASTAESYPNVLNQAGTSDAAWSQPFEDDFAFRKLPNGGRRSPRSSLFCELVSCHAAPYVDRLSHAQACANPAAVGHESDPDRRELDSCSDSDACEMMWDRLYEHDFPVPPHQLMTALHEASRPHIAAQLRTPALRVDYIMDDTCFPDECISEIRSIVEEHFAGGGTSNSVILNARLSAIEDRYLAAEAEEEAIDDLQCALKRLREGIKKCVAVATDPAQSSNINSLFSTRCTNRQQVREYC